MRSVAPKINPKDTARSTQSAIVSITKDIDHIKKQLDTSSASGAKDINQKYPDIRLVQDGENYYIEAKFDSGWARLPQSMTLITKRD